MPQEIVKQHRLHLTPLSPIHMGTAEDFDPTNYVIDQDSLYTFDPLQVTRTIPEPERKQLLRTLAGRPDDRMLSAVQQFFYRNRERLLPEAPIMLPVSSGIRALYEKRIGQTANLELKGRRVINALEIERTAYTPGSFKPILPGSGLKGAIRTALLESERATRHSGRRWRWNEHREMQQKLFGYEMRELSRDPMRLVRVADGALDAAVEMPVTRVQFAVNRARKQKPGGQSTQAEQKGLSQKLECVLPGYRSFQATLEILQPGTAARNRAGLPAIRWDMGEIATACNAFYLPLLQREVRAINNRGLLDSDWKHLVAQLERPALRQKLDNGSAFLLRVGRHSGAEALTLNEVRSIRIPQEKDKRRQWQPAPKTWWLASGDEQDQRHLIPFGWLLVELDSEPDSTLQQAFTDFSRPLVDWRARAAQRRSALRAEQAKEQRAREAREQRLVAEKAREREREEAARQAEQARQEEARRERAAFEALPEVEKKIQLLNREVAAFEDREPPLPKDDYAQIVGSVSRATELASSWAREEREKMADRIESLYEQFGWAPSGLKRKQKAKQEAKKRDMIEKLRQGE